MSAGKDMGDLQEIGMPGVAEDLTGGLLLRCQDVICDYEQEVQHILSLGCQIGCKFLGSCTQGQPVLHSTHPSTDCPSGPCRCAVYTQSPSVQKSHLKGLEWIAQGLFEQVHDCKDSKYTSAGVVAWHVAEEHFQGEQRW